MATPIQSVAILGAGTMGAQIAAHFANAGVSVLLLDLTNQIASEGLKRARHLTPDPFFSVDVAGLIKTGGFDGDLARVGDVDWIIEAVIEQIEIKQSLLAQVDAVSAPGTIFPSNPSGIPISVLATGRSADFRRHWLGTHFFNPPRYLRLLEIIPNADTDPAVVARVASFAEVCVGK